MSIMECSECGLWVDTDEGGYWSEATDREFCDRCVDRLMDDEERMPGDPGWDEQSTMEFLKGTL